MFPGDDQVADMQAQIEALRQAENMLFSDDQLASSEIDPSFIKSCLYNNQRGDGILFSRLHRGKFVQVVNWERNGAWLGWSDHHWYLDKENAVKNAVEEVAKTYLTEALRLKKIADATTDKAEKQTLNAERKLYLKRVNTLRTVAGVKNCLEWATMIGKGQQLTITGEDVDTHPWKLACKNGVIDLRTGKFKPGVPEDYLLWAIPFEWVDINAPCPTWEHFFDEIHQGDATIKHFLQKYFGYLLTGATIHHVVGVFTGEGRNGKGTMFDLLRELLGDLAWTITPEMLMEQKNARSTAGASADLMSFRGRRALFAEESDEYQKISESAYKKLSGGGNIKARAPFDRAETNFVPTHKIVFYTNFLPRGLAASFAMKKRLILVDYPLKFVNDPDPADPNQRRQDPDLPAKLRAEMSGILAWLVRGCLMMQEEGLLIPEIMRKDIDAQERKDDTILNFFNDMIQVVLHPDDPTLHDHDSKVAFKDIYGTFEAWYEDSVSKSDKSLPTKKRVSAWFDKRGFKRSKPCGIAHIHGLRIKIEGDLL